MLMKLNCVLIIYGQQYAAILLFNDHVYMQHDFINN